MLRYFRLLLILPLLFSCQRKEAKFQKNKLKLNFFAEPATLDPRKASYSIYTNIFPMLYDGLTRFGPDGELLLSVAEKVDVSEDGKRYTFTLRPTYWSNGDPVTAENFASTWRWMINSENPAPLVNHLFVIKNGKAISEGKKGIEEFGAYAKDSDTLIVELEEPLPYFLDLVAMYNFFPVHPQEGVVNGPFVLTEWLPHQQMKLKKNPCYWEQSVVKIEKIVIQFIQDAHTELKLFEQGAFDWAGAPLSLGPPVDALPSLKSTQRLEMQPFLGTNFYTVNTKKAPLNNPKVRKALSLSIPREEICLYVTQAGERPAYDFIPDLIKSTQPNPEIDPKEIKKLFLEGLQEEGLSPRELRAIAISYNVSETNHRVAQAIQDRWRSWFGIDVRLKSSDWKAHQSEVKAGNFDIARMQWKGLSLDPVNYIEIFSDPHHCMHNCSWENGHFQDLYTQALASRDPEVRLQLTDKMEEEMRKEIPIFPIYYGTMSFVRSENLSGVVLIPIGAVDFKWARKR